MLNTAGPDYEWVHKLLVLTASLGTWGEHKTTDPTNIRHTATDTTITLTLQAHGTLKSHSKTSAIQQPLSTEKQPYFINILTTNTSTASYVCEPCLLCQMWKPTHHEPTESPHCSAWLVPTQFTLVIMLCICSLHDQHTNTALSAVKGKGKGGVLL